MKKGLLIYILFAGGVLTLSPAFSQEISEIKKAEKLLQTLEKNHVEPPENDSLLSERWFFLVFEQLDSRCVLFTETDKVILGKHRSSLVEEVRNGKADFFENLTEIYQKRLTTADSLVRAFSKSSFTLKSKDTLWLLQKNDRPNVPKNQAEMAVKWKRRIHYEWLNALHTITKEKEPSLAEQGEAWEKASKRLLCQFETVLKQANYREFIGEYFLNALAQAFDPHCIYYPYRLRDALFNSVSMEENSFGLLFTKNKQGEIEIESMTPGSSAWKSNQLHNGDVLLEIVWPDGKKLDFLCFSPGQLEYQLDYSVYETASVKVKKTNGQELEVVVRKEPVKVEENTIVGYVLEGEKKIGYLSIPSFYSAWEYNNPEGCANDLAKEILKLKTEGIEGLILDVRYNSGGALHEALNLAGLFIDYGVLAMEKGREGKPHSLKDPNRGAAYTDPLIILVNGSSASASELLAVSLQTVNRAIVVGNPTYGKGTAQATFSVDSLNPKYGTVSITLSKIFDINGNTYQYKGVHPDIVLPDPYEIYAEKEADEHFPLEESSIHPSKYAVKMSPLPIDELRQASKKRISESPEFQEVVAKGQKLSKMEEEDLFIPLAWEGFKNYHARFEELFEELDSLYESQTFDYKVEEVSFNKEVYQMDELAFRLSQETKKAIQEDIYIQECYLILKNSINLKH